MNENKSLVNTEGHASNADTDSENTQGHYEDENDTVELEPVGDVAEPAQTPLILPRWKRPLYKGVTLASVLLNPSFAIFLYFAIAAAIDNGREEMSLGNKFWALLFIAINITVSCLSGLSDVIVVNPIEEAEEILDASDKNALAIRLNNVSRRQKFSIKAFNYFNQTIGNSVFLVGSASAALSIAYLSSSRILRWGIGIPVTALELIYLNRLSSGKIEEHSYQFIHNIFSNGSSVTFRLLKSPAKLLEVLIQVLINAANRGVVYGYIMEQIMKEFFNRENDQLSTGVISYMVMASFYTSLTSRTLNVYKQFFNPEFQELSTESLQNTRISYIGLTVDGTMAFLRAGATSLLLYRHGPSNLPLNIAVSASTGIFLMVHGMYTRYDNRLHRTALDIKLQEIVNNDHQPTAQLSSSETFDLIKEQFKVNNIIKILATIINSGSRLANWFSFLGFLITMNKLVKLNGEQSLDFYDLLCLQQLLCNPSLENEISFFQESMVDILAYYRTKIYLEKKLPNFGWGSFWKAKRDYAKEYLVEVLSMATDMTNPREIELEQVSLSNLTH